ncbi:hypothetical protein Goshw_011716 [Gossypium schwendimanii]|uniref:Uncharacterized protein n=1 Tax=Gossypium schwendimanii TaxID=34291 RepID=A0A7J9M4M9_GOSSC|nr:hypothetical protein [Gossypium schwendimanii]
MCPMEVYRLDGEHLAHKSWPNLKNYWRSLSD